MPATVDARDVRYVSGQIVRLPPAQQETVAAHYDAIVARDTPDARRQANIYLRHLGPVVGGQWAQRQPIPGTPMVAWLHWGDIAGRKWPHVLDAVMRPHIGEARLIHAERWLGRKIPGRRQRTDGSIDSSPAIARTYDDHWMCRAARLQWRLWRSIMDMRHAPTVTRYCSATDAECGADARRRAREFLTGHEIVDKNGTVAPLPSPEQKARGQYAQLMAVARGLGVEAGDASMEARLVTISLPSIHHRTTSAGGGRRENPHYVGTTPAEGHQMLARAWAACRRQLGPDRLAIPIAWVRATQPHIDGTPHWHLVVWAPPDRWGELEAALTKYMVDGIPDRADAPTDRRLRIDRISGGAQGAIAYVSRCLAYVARCIAERHGGGDEAERASNWASTHGIRRYQCSQDTHATAWRYLARADMPTPTMEMRLAKEAREDGDHALFARLVKKAGIRPAYREEVNHYGETVKRLIGLRQQLPDGSELTVVPTSRWQTRRKPPKPPKSVGKTSASRAPSAPRVALGGLAGPDSDLVISKNQEGATDAPDIHGATPASHEGLGAHGGRPARAPP